MKRKNKLWIKELSKKATYLSTINVINLIEIEDNRLWHSIYRDYIHRTEV